MGAARAAREPTANLVSSAQSVAGRSRQSIAACSTALADEVGGRRNSNSKHAVAKQTTNMNLKSLT
jgi:hypothetical protein